MWHVVHGRVAVPLLDTVDADVAAAAGVAVACFCFCCCYKLTDYSS